MFYSIIYTMREAHRPCETEQDYLQEWNKIKTNLEKCLDKYKLNDLQKSMVESIIDICRERISQASQPGFKWSPIKKDES